VLCRKSKEADRQSTRLARPVRRHRDIGSITLNDEGTGFFAPAARGRHAAAAMADTPAEQGTPFADLANMNRTEQRRLSPPHDDDLLTLMIAATLNPGGAG